MKLILLDPSEVFRIGLWAVLSRRRSDLEILDDAASADPTRIASLKPDLVVTDLRRSGHQRRRPRRQAQGFGPVHPSGGPRS
jgi:hypothetical protein